MIPQSTARLGLAEDFFSFLKNVIWGRIQDFGAGASRHGPPKAGPRRKVRGLSLPNIFAFEVLGNETKSVYYDVSFLF